MLFYYALPISDVVHEVDDLASDYLQKVRGLSSEKRRQQLSSIQQLFNKGREYGDDKVQLAMQTYELVSVLKCHCRCQYAEVSHVRDGIPIVANPPGFPGNLPDFETGPGIPDLKNKFRILKVWGEGIISSTLSGIAVTIVTHKCIALFVFYFLPRILI